MMTRSATKSVMQRERIIGNVSMQFAVRSATDPQLAQKLSLHSNKVTKKKPKVHKATNMMKDISSISMAPCFATAKILL